MASVSTEEGVMAQSPQSAEPAEKLNGDGDLDYTITMNESEDEASSDDDSTNLKNKENGKSESPKVNGKMPSDDEAKSKDVEDKDGSENQTQDNGVEEDGEKGEKSSVQEEEKMDVDDEAKNVQESDQKDADKTPKGEKNDSVSKSKKKTEKTEKKEKPDKDKPEEVQREKRPTRAAAKKRYVEEDIDFEDDDDDIVEIKGSPMKQPAKSAGPASSKNKLSPTGSKPSPTVGKPSPTVGKPSPGKPSPSMGKPNPTVGKPSPIVGKPSPTVVSTPNSLSGQANFVPYLNSLPVASSLSTPPGLQLVQVTSGTQGSSLMYVQNNMGMKGSSSVFNAGMANFNKIQSTNSASLLPQYSSMLTNQNRFIMPQMNQGARPAMNTPPMLTNIPDKPTSSIGMIENIRWEVENHINIKPKYAKPNPKAELGNLAKWMFDLGSDMVKEFVYHDLVRIQQNRKTEGNLSDKEKDDFVKLQEIDKELNNKIGHLKVKLNKSCKCGFRTELSNVLYNHKQHAHFERGGFFCCILCKFSTRQQNTFRFHMESVHGRAGITENRPSFFECPSCPYETNYTNRLDQHKIRCQKQFREAFNLHPSCVTGPEVNLCLENVFYFVFTRQFQNSITPKQTPLVPATKPTTSETITAMKNMQTRRGIAGNTGTTPTASPHQLVPRPQNQTVTTAIKQQQQMGSAASRNFAAGPAKMNTVANKPGPAAFNQARAPVTPQNQQTPPNQPNNGFEVCEICGGYVKDRKALRIHFYYAHRIDMPFGVFERPLAPLYCATCFARFWTAQGLQKHIEVHKNDMMGTTQTSNGVAGKCISCGHRVPNILMHMRMVHNRELRHYLAALMCIFCGSRFTTKKEVESHMGKMHGVIVKNSNIQSGPEKPQPKPKISPKSSKPNTSTPKASGSSSKGGSKMNAGSQCVLCNLSFPRNVDLTRHCMRVHHTCMKCGLVVVDKESLARHTCLHSASGMRTCQICKETGFHPAYYIKHMRDRHLRKCSVVLRHIDRAVVDTMKRPITISDSEEDEPKTTEAKRPKTSDASKPTTDVGEQKESDTKSNEDEKEVCNSSAVDSEKVEADDEGRLKSTEEGGEGGDEENEADVEAGKDLQSEDKAGEGEAEVAEKAEAVQSAGSILKAIQDDSDEGSDAGNDQEQDGEKTTKRKRKSDQDEDDGPDSKNPRRDSL